MNERLTPSTDLAQAYGPLRRLLLTALANLARHGCVAAPDEGLDLIHDFIIEEWPKLVARFDPQQARLETYVYAAFLRFARHRIVRVSRFREGLMAPLEISEIAERDRTSGAAEQERRPDLEKLRAAVARLPEREAGLIRAYVSDEKPSERKLAVAFSLSRHQVRLALADAFGAIAAQLGEASALTPLQRRVLNALWREQRTIKETAHALGVSPEEIQAMRAHFSRLLAHATDDAVSRSSAPGRERNNEIAAGLLRVLQNKSTASDRADIKANIVAVLAFLEGPEGEEFLARHAPGAAPDTIAELYDLLGDPPHLPPEDRQMLDQLLVASTNEAATIGKAFCETLLPNLRNDLKVFKDLVFLGAPPIDAQEYEVLLEEPSVVHGGEKARELARFGITPETVVAGAQGIANAAQTFCLQTNIEKNGVFQLDRGTMADRAHPMPLLLRKDAIDGMREMCDLHPKTSDRFYDWLCNVSEYTPFLFDGFHTELWGDRLRMRWTRESHDDLFQRWRPPSSDRRLVA